MRAARAPGPRHRATRGWLGVLVFALAVLGHLAQGAHHSRHVHLVVGGVVVHLASTAHASDVGDDGSAPSPFGSLRAAAGDEERCDVPAPDRVRISFGTIAPACTAPRCDVVPAASPARTPRTRDVLAYAPKHSPPYAPTS
ncbi:MAG: hypothetical protein U1F36_09945 [Planctomycetota bacterium]